MAPTPTGGGSACRSARCWPRSRSRPGSGCGRRRSGPSRSSASATRASTCSTGTGSPSTGRRGSRRRRRRSEPPAGWSSRAPGSACRAGSLTPAFLPGLPLVLAAGTWLGGLGGALLMPAVLGGCAVLSFGGLVGRLAGAWWAAVGALVLAVSLPEIYVSRTPFSEPLVQVLLFGGLCMFIDSFGVRRRRAGAGRAGRARARADGAGLDRVAEHPAARVPRARLAVRGAAAAGGAVRDRALRSASRIGLAVALTLGRSYLSTASTELHMFGLAAAGFGVADGADRAARVPGRARPGVARVHRPAAHHGAGGRGDLPAVAGDGRAVGGGGAAGGRAHRAGRPAVRADRPRADQTRP